MESTTNNPITLGDMVSYRRNVTNLGDENRAYDIKAIVCFEEGSVHNFDSGEVYPLNSDGDDHIIAYFSGRGNPGRLNIIFVDTADRHAVLSAIDTFLAQVLHQITTRHEHI